MKPRIYFTLALTMLLTAMSYASVAQESDREPIARIIEAKGKVELKRENRSSYTAAPKGTYLYFGDLLRASRGARVLVQCSSDRTTWRVPDDSLPWGVANTCSPSALGRQGSWGARVQGRWEDG